LFGDGRTIASGKCVALERWKTALSYLLCRFDYSQAACLWRTL